MIRWTVLTLLTMLAATPSFGTPVVDVSAELSSKQIAPGAPLHVYLKLTRLVGTPFDDEVITVRIDSRFQMEVEMLDMAGEVLPQLPEEPWYPAGSGFSLVVPLDPGGSFTKTMIAQRWVSTDLPEGEYVLRIVLKGFNWNPGGVRDRRGDVSSALDGPVEFLLPLHIGKRDDDAVRAQFRRYFDQIFTPDATEELAEGLRRLAFDTIVFARGAKALPFQLDLVRRAVVEDVKLNWGNHRQLEMFRYIAHSGDANTARQLVALAMDPVFDQYRRNPRSANSGPWMFIDYAIREMHREGNEAVMEETTSFVEKVSPARPIVKGQFISGPTSDNDDY